MRNAGGGGWGGLGHADPQGGPGFRRAARLGAGPTESRGSERSASDTDRGKTNEFLTQNTGKRLAPPTSTVVVPPFTDGRGATLTARPRGPQILPVVRRE